MRSIRDLGGQFLGAVILIQLISPAEAAPGKEPLIISQLRDPDPGLPAASEPKLELIPLQDTEDKAARLAVENFSRAMGDALSAQREATERRCRSAASPNTTAERFAWAANCRYSRH